MIKKRDWSTIIPLDNGMYYNKSNKLLITRINTSVTGNIYLSCLKSYKKITIVYRLCVGHSKVFFNSIIVSSYLDGKRRIIGTQFYDGFSYDEREIISCAKQIIYKDIVRAFIQNRTQIDKAKIKEYIEILIDDTLLVESILF